MAQRIMAAIGRIEDLGELVKAVESGWLHREISAYNYKYQRSIETGETKVVGVNYQPAEKGSCGSIDVFKYPETYTRQKAKLERLRRERDSKKVKECLAVIRDKCHSDENLYPYTIAAVKNLATLGEIEEVFREEFGLWAFPLY
jgi:methylmalonyl-CoA mutase N-terminal domain/subunit